LTENNVKFNDVRYCYGEVCAIHKADFEIKRGSLTIFVGPNGGGKSTLIKLLSGFLKPDKGSVDVENNGAIGYVSQGFGFDDSFPITVKEIVLTGTLDKKILPFKKYSKEQHKKADEAIEKVGLKGFDKRGVSQLSGGQLKRVVIARALASEAEILVLDEPDSNLDIEAVKDLYQLLKDLKDSKTIIVASHNIDFILDISDTAVYVNKTARFFENPQELKEKLKEGMII